MGMIIYSWFPIDYDYEWVNNVLIVKTSNKPYLLIDKFWNNWNKSDFDPSPY